MTRESETNGLTVNYTYDAAGNRSQMAVTGTETYTTVYTYDANNRLLTETKTENNEAVTTTYTYDPNGNTLSKSTPAHDEDEASSTTYTYNGFNQMIALTVDGTDVAYAYNAQGIRTAKRVNNLRTAYLLDGGNVVAEVQNNTVTNNYLRGVNLIRRTSTDETEYYLFNAHSDVVTTTNLNGTINQEYDYDAFGNEKNPDALDTNPFRYCGEYLDFETGAYYLRARYYDSSIGRFTQQDTHWNTANMIYGDNPQKINECEDSLGLKTYSYAPQISAIGQSGNLYIYCGNSPVKYYDATGETGVLALQWTSSMWWLIGADGPVPIGDLVYVVGIGVLSIVDALLLIGAAEGTASKAETSTALANSMATSAASPGAPDPKDDKDSISRNLQKHIINRHDPHKAAQELRRMTPQQAANKFAGRSFFNASWSETQIMNAVNCGYQQAMQAGFTNGNYVFSYAGEQITLCFENGILQTAYGSHYYTIEQLLALLI